MPSPMWRRIAEDLRQKIESGELGADGMPLPSELELRDRYEASRNTVRDAVKWLVSRGLVDTRPGQGTFAVKKIEPFFTNLTEVQDAGSAAYSTEVAAVRRKATVSAPRIEVHQAESEIAEQLRLPAGSLALSRHQQRYIDDIPWSLQTTFYPMSLIDKGATDLLVAQDKPEGVVSYLEAVLGIHQVGWQDLVKVRAPDATESVFFGLPDDGRVAVLVHRRTAFEESRTPFRLTITTFPADRNQFIYEVWHGQITR